MLLLKSGGSRRKYLEAKKWKMGGAKELVQRSISFQKRQLHITCMTTIASQAQNP